MLHISQQVITQNSMSPGAHLPPPVLSLLAPPPRPRGSGVKTCGVSEAEQRWGGGSEGRLLFIHYCDEGG